jgi:hypothetical protein
VLTARGDGRTAGLDGRLALGAEALHHNPVQFRLANAHQAGGDAQRDHVGPSAGDLFRQRLHLHLDQPRARGGHDLGRRPEARVADDQTVGVEHDLVCEAIGLVPVDGDDGIEAIVHALHRVRRQTHEGRRFAAADLRAHRAGHQAVPAAAAGGFQKQPRRGHRPCATAAENGQADAAAGGIGSGAWCSFRRGHGLPPGSGSVGVLVMSHRYVQK